MWKAFLQPVKAIFPIVALIIALGFSNTASSQQNIIINKDNTRPETTRPYNDVRVVTSFAINKYNGYNEVSWSPLSDELVRGYTVEYSINGIDYLTAGTAIANNGKYSVKHYTNENRPIYYRIRNESTKGQYVYSPVKELGGIEDSPVKLQSTMIRGNVVNAVADKPVQRVNVFSGNGDQVYARDVNGQKDFISTTLPILNRGIYYMTFYGTGWQDTQKFIIL